MPVRGVRGATVVEANEPQAIYASTIDLLRAISEANPTLRPADVASAFFSVPRELDSAFPALAARTLPGWKSVPLLCCQEIPVPDALRGVLRVLLHWNTDQLQEEVRHVYLRETAKLHPDLESAKS